MRAEAWPTYVAVLAVLTLEWPFCIQIADGAEVYLSVVWTASAAAYVLGPPILPIFWLSATLGWVLIVWFDRRGWIEAKGVAAENLKRLYGEPYRPGNFDDGMLRQVEYMLSHLWRVGLRAVLPLPLIGTVVVTEVSLVLLSALIPVPGRNCTRAIRTRLAAALGTDIMVALDLLHLGMVIYLVATFELGGVLGFCSASAGTLVLHAIVHRLNAARVESEHGRAALERMRDERDRHERLATIGQTATKVFHQIGRQHGTIGLYAHLLARRTGHDGSADDIATVRDHAERIALSVAEANRIMDELLRFAQDRMLNLYPQVLAELVDECVEECRARAAAHAVEVSAVDLPAVLVTLDKHKIKQVVGNLLDNAIDAAPQGSRVEIEAQLTDDSVRIAIRDRGAGVPPSVRERLFTPFATTKPDGIGLGLALARELMDAHGGTIGWRSLDPGTEFQLVLPLIAPASDARLSSTAR